MSGCLQFRAIPEHGASNVWVSAIPGCLQSLDCLSRPRARCRRRERLSARPGEQTAGAATDQVGHACMASAATSRNSFSVAPLAD